MGAPFTSAICRPVSIGAAPSGMAPSRVPSIVAAVERVLLHSSHVLARASFAQPTRLRIKASTHPIMEYRMAKLTLYHAAPSRSSIARWMLEEIGEPYDIHLLSLSKGEQQKPDYLAVNPMGKVPALKHGDTVITEVAAICAYLADEFPRAKLSVPIGKPRRGVYLKWLFFGPSCIEPAMIDRAFPRKEEARRAHAGLRRFRHRDGRGGEGGREGPVSHGRAVHRRRRGRRLGLALGHDVQAPARASRIRCLHRGLPRARRCSARKRRTRSSPRREVRRVLPAAVIAGHTRGEDARKSACDPAIHPYG